MIAFFEYMLQVPANRIGYTGLDLSRHYIWAAMCVLGAVYFVFRI